MANHNSFIHNIGLNENNSLSHLLETISPDMEDESNIIEESKYYDDTDFKDALQQYNSKISILSLNCQSINSIQFNSYVYFRHKKSIYNKIYIQLDKIYIRIYNNAIRSIRTKKGDFKENIFIMLQCRTTNSKCLRVTNRNQYRIIRNSQPIYKAEYIFPQ